MVEEAKISMSEHNDILHELRIDYEKIIKEPIITSIENISSVIECCLWYHMKIVHNLFLISE